jgi:hypothetical protein
MIFNFNLIHYSLSNSKMPLLFLPPFLWFFTQVLIWSDRELCSQIIIQYYYFLFIIFQVPYLQLFIISQFINLQSFVIFQLADLQSFLAVPCFFILYLQNYSSFLRCPFFLLFVLLSIYSFHCFITITVI